MYLTKNISYLEFVNYELLDKSIYLNNVKHIYFSLLIVSIKKRAF